MGPGPVEETDAAAQLEAIETDEGVDVDARVAAEAAMAEEIVRGLRSEGR